MATRTEIEAIIKLRDEMSARVKTIDRSLGKLDSSLKRTKQTSAGFTGNLKKGALQAVAFGGAAGIAAISVSKLVGAIGDGVRGFVSFEKSMLRIETLVGVARGEVEGMKDSVRGIAAATGRGPEELAEALFQITSAGLRGESALDALESSAKAAAIGLGETKDIADAATSIVAAYGEENVSASEAVDILTATVRLGKGAAVEYAGAFGNVVSVAANIGVSIQEVGTVMAILTKTTGSANLASTQLASIMRQVIKPSNEAADALESAKTSIDAVRESIREKGLVVTLQDLRDKMHPDAFIEFAGRAEAINAVLGTTGSRFRETADAALDMNDAFGIVNEGVARLEEDASFRAEKVATAWTNAMDEIGGLVVVWATFAMNVHEALVTLNPFVEELKVANVAALDAATNFTLLEQSFEHLSGQSDVLSGPVTEVTKSLGEQARALLATKEHTDLMAEASSAAGIKITDMALAFEVLRQANAAELIEKSRAKLEELRGTLRASGIDVIKWKDDSSQAAIDTGIAMFTFHEEMGEVTAGVGDLTAGMSAAFAFFGQKTQAQLDATAARAKMNFEIISAAGQFTVDELTTMWDAYEKARVEAAEITSTGMLGSMEGFKEGSTAIFKAQGGDFKSSAVAGVDIAVQSAIAKSLAAAPWPLSLILAAGAAAAGAIIKSKIRGLSPGFQTGTRRLDFQDFGQESSVAVHGREAIIPRGGGHQLGQEVAKSLSGGGGGSVGGMGPVSITLSPVINVTTLATNESELSVKLAPILNEMISGGRITTELTRRLEGVFQRRSV